MPIKYCSRCHFAVLAKKRICQTCGGKNFVYEEISIRSGSANSTHTVNAIADRLGNFMQGLSHDLVETADKSLRASKQVGKLIKGRDASSQPFEK